MPAPAGAPEAVPDCPVCAPWAPWLATAPTPEVTAPVPADSAAVPAWVAPLSAIPAPCSPSDMPVAAAPAAAAAAGFAAWQHRQRDRQRPQQPGNGGQIDHHCPGVRAQNSPYSKLLSAIAGTVLSNDVRLQSGFTYTISNDGGYWDGGCDSRPVRIDSGPDGARRLLRECSPRWSSTSTAPPRTASSTDRPHRQTTPLWPLQSRPSEWPAGCG